MVRGCFITFEGIEGAGKSTQIRRLAVELRDKNDEIIVTREPGGSPGAEAVRHVLLSGAAEPFGPETEALLFAAARSDHIEQVIRPAVERGAVVLCDRFFDSSCVYQGVTGNLDLDFMAIVERVAINGMMPDMTMILDIDPEEGLRRATARRGTNIVDRFERETVAIHQKRRDAYLTIATREPERCVVIDATQTQDEVANVITEAVLAVLEQRADSCYMAREDA